MVIIVSFNVCLINLIFGKVIGWFKSNIKFKVIVKILNNWYWFSFKGKNGYVFGKYVKVVIVVLVLKFLMLKIV